MTEGWVIDVSVAVKWVFPERDTPAARRILEGQAAGRWTLMAPDVFLAEGANTIWKKCRLRQEITAEEAFQGLDFLLQTVPRLVSSSSLAGQALRLALSYRVPVYDCLYLALALQERCGLVTADAALVRATGPHLGMVVELADFAGWTR
ncbi:MAG: type II toxin-antitoxin system VapC family toxin [Thermaerobacter sp.]|jgi:predicted nucleic acid-binding protein|nr:type II toxin-antitoxin system VapC family toxin [Thermaerobacter sp.]